MVKSKISWCFRLKDGLNITEPNTRLADSYRDEARNSLLRAEKNFEDNDLLWTTVVIYYAEYYALYSFLQKIGIKCENHTCSIAAVTELLCEEKTRTINDHKNKRIDAQYYMRVDKKGEVEQMLREAQMVVAMFDEMISNLSDEKIERYRTIMKKFSVL